MKNLILSTDSYKITHPFQYPENMTYMHDYIESRGGLYGYVKFFGLQYYLMEYQLLPSKILHTVNLYHFLYFNLYIQL